jgi:excisionase family DNA binding protein
MNKVVFTMTETAYHLSLTEPAVQKLVDAGQIPYRQLGSETRFLVTELEEWLRRLPGVGVEEARRNMAQATEELTTRPRGKTRPPVLAHVAQG